MHNELLRESLSRIQSFDNDFSKLNEMYNFDNNTIEIFKKILLNNFNMFSFFESRLNGNSFLYGGKGKIFLGKPRFGEDLKVYTSLISKYPKYNFELDEVHIKMDNNLITSLDKYIKNDSIDITKNVLKKNLFINYKLVEDFCLLDEYVNKLVSSPFNFVISFD